MSLVRSASLAITLCASLLGCKKAPPANDQPAPAPVPEVAKATPDATVAATADAGTRRLFLDVHHLGKGKVTIADMAAGHQLDLAKQGKHDVNYRDYWVNVEDGNVYCLAEAPSAEAASAVHRDVDGTVADVIWPVTEAAAIAAAKGGMKLFMTTHNMGPGKVAPEAIAEAHKKDLAAQAKYGANFLNYWVDPASGTVHWLVEAPTKEAVMSTHKDGDGLVPDSVEEVVHGS